MLDEQLKYELGKDNKFVFILKIGFLSSLRPQLPHGLPFINN